MVAVAFMPRFTAPATPPRRGATPESAPDRLRQRRAHWVHASLRDARSGEGSAIGRQTDAACYFWRSPTTAGGGIISTKMGVRSLRFANA